MRQLGLGHATLVIIGLVVFATWPQAAHLATGVNDFGDSLLNAWALAWVAHAVWASPRHLFDANIFYPEPRTLAYSETLLLPALLIAPVVWLGGDPILAHNLLMLGGYVLSGMAMFLLVRHLTGHNGAALVAAAAFAIAPYRMETFGKMQLALTWWWPLAFLALHRLAASPGRARAMGLAAFAAAEMYTCVYYGVFGAIGLAVVALTLVVARPHQRGFLVRSLAFALMGAAVMVVPLIGPYRTASGIVGERSVDDVVRGSAMPSDYLRAHPESWLYGDANHPGEGERRLFPGYAAPALTLVALLPPFDVVTAAYVVLGGVAFDLSLGTNGVGYRSLYDAIWPLRALRVTARFAMLVAFALSVLCGIGVARVCRGRAPWAQALGVTACLMAVTVEGRMRPVELSTLADRSPAVYAWLAQQPVGPICEYPVGRLEGRLGPQDPTYMYYSTRHWRPMVNGYSGFEPPSYGALINQLRDFPDDTSIAYLRARGVTYLLVHSPFYIEGDFAADVRALRARQDVTFTGMFPWKGGGQTAVFLVRR